MARAALHWNLLDVQEKTGINKNTIVRFEAGKGVLFSTAIKLEDAFTRAGIIFTYEADGRSQGVAFSKELAKKLDGTIQSGRKPTSGKRSQKNK